MQVGDAGCALERLGCAGGVDGSAHCCGCSQVVRAAPPEGKDLDPARCEPAHREFGPEVSQLEGQGRSPALPFAAAWADWGSRRGPVPPSPLQRAGGDRHCRLLQTERRLTFSRGAPVDQKVYIQSFVVKKTYLFFCLSFHPSYYKNANFQDFL